MSKLTNDGLINPAWHRMLYSYIHMATVGVKWLMLKPDPYLLLITGLHVQWTNSLLN